MKYPNFNINNKPKKNPKLVYTLYLTQSSGELASSEVCCSGCGQRNPITELIQSHVFLYILSELNSADKQKPNNSKNQSKPKNPTKKESKIKKYIYKKTKGGGIENQSENLSPASPLAAMSLWESRTMILSSLDLWTSMLWTAEESATTMANPLPTNPNTHSMIYECMSFRFSLLIFLCVGVWELLIWFCGVVWSKTLNKHQRFSALRKKLRDFCFCFVFLKQGLGLYGLRNGPIWCGDFFLSGPKFYYRFWDVF